MNELDVYKSMQGWTLTVGQVRKAMKRHKYIMVEDYDGCKFAVNCKIGRLGFNGMPKNKERTEFVSCYPVGLQEYINYKIPYYPKDYKL